MPSTKHWGLSENDSSDDDNHDNQRHISPHRGRRAASVNGVRRPGFEQHQSYHRPSSERRHRSPKQSDSDSGSDSDGGYRRSRRRSSRRSPPSPRASSPSHGPSRASRDYRPASRARSVDDHRLRRHREASPEHRHHREQYSPDRKDYQPRHRPASTSPRNNQNSGHRSSSTASKDHRYPPSASRSRNLPSKSRRGPSAPPPRPKRRGSDIMLSVGRCALEAGAMAALKLKDDPSPWLGAKGAKVATAALTAACVDSYMEQKHPSHKGGLRHTVMRQATQLAIGNLVAKPAATKVEGAAKAGKIKMPHPRGRR